MITFNKYYVSKELILSLARQHVMNHYWFGNEYDIDDVYIIRYYDTVIGLMVVTIGEYKNHKTYANIEMVELISPCKGRDLGRQVVLRIFELLKVSAIYGESLPSAIPFWKGCNADFEMSNKKLTDYYNKGLSACFKLTKSRFMGS